MSKIIWIGLILILLGISPVTLEAQQEEVLRVEELARFLGIRDQMKIPLTQRGVEIQVQIYRNDSPRAYEDVDTGLSLSPDEIRPVGSMYSHGDGDFFFILIMQRLFVLGEESHVVHWGIRTEDQERESLSRSSFALELEEFQAPDYSWIHGIYRNVDSIQDTFTPVYMFGGRREGEGGTVFSSYEWEDPSVQAQLFDVLLVVVCRSVEYQGRPEQ